MAISFSGLGSGLNTSEWVTALVGIKQDKIDTISSKVTTLNSTSSTLSGLKTNYSALLSAITKLTDSNFGASSNVFAQNKITSSDTAKLSVTSSAGASQQSLEVEIFKLATNTVAQSSSAIARPIDADTVFSSLSNGSAKTGSFSFYVDNQKYSIDIEKDDTLGKIKDKMTDATKSEANPIGLLSITIDGGKFTVDAGTKALNMGSTLDESNLPTILSLKKDSTLNVNKFSSSNSINEMNLNAKLISSDSGFATGVTAGDFTIGNAKFTIDENTTLNSLIAKINGSTDAGVTASFDAINGKMVLTAKQTGAFNINVQDIAGGSNFLQSAGFTSSNKIIEGTQKLGENASFSINGNTIESFSNTVTSESTGIMGLTFNLNDKTETDKKITVKIEQDTSQALNAVSSFLDAFNLVMTKTDSLTKSTGALKNEASLTSIRNNLRTTTSEAVSGNATLKTLADIGITSGKPGTAIDANVNQLQIDKDKFLKALQTNPDEVKNLLIGNTKEGTTGVIGDLKTIVEGAIDVDKGFFKTRNDSIQSQIKTLNTQITRKTSEMESYKELLTSQFNAMDQAIAKLKNQYSNFTSATS